MIKELMLSVNDSRIWVVAALFLLAFLLAVIRHDLIWHTARIYNWDGRKYRFLGRERLRKINDTYVINMREAVGDASYTTIYLLLVSAKFVRRHRYENLLLRAGEGEVWLPVEKRMRQEVLYTHGFSGVYGRRIKEHDHSQLVYDREK
ncbi:MAG: hypothetical protein K2N00_09270 [Lachnospiraceae bacterium]|nr:hypothetical protein [Lachnospiraceae bacterium]